MRGLEKSLRDWCENEGVRWRRTLRLYAYDPLPSKCLAQHLEIPVLNPTEIPGIDEQALQCLLEKEAGWSALAIPISAGKHWIIYNPTHAPTRHESNVMHELAHLLLNHQPIRFHYVSGSIPMREYRPADEKAAEYLGGCLQIPARGLDWAFQRSMTHQEVADHFGASVQMVRYRCNMTGRQCNGS